MQFRERTSPECLALIDACIVACALLRAKIAASSAGEKGSPSMLVNDEPPLTS